MYLIDKCCYHGASTYFSSPTKGELLELVVRQAALIEQLEEKVKALEGRVNKDSHNSHLAPSQSPFQKKIKNLRKKTGKDQEDKKDIQAAHCKW